MVDNCIEQCCAIAIQQNAAAHGCDFYAWVRPFQSGGHGRGNIRYLLVPDRALFPFQSDGTDRDIHY
jgi:hypothetical protein